MSSSSSSASRVSETMTEPCEVCSTDEQFVRATVFCVDCSQRLCDRCSLPHKRWKRRPHDVRPLGEELVGAVERDVQKLELTGKLKF